MNYRYRKNDYNTGVQLQPNNFETLYSILYFDLRENKDNKTNDPKSDGFPLQAQRGRRRARLHHLCGYFVRVRTCSQAGGQRAGDGLATANPTPQYENNFSNKYKDDDLLSTQD